MFAALLLTLIQAAPASTAEPEILVEGQAKTDIETRNEAHGFIRAIAAPAGSADQLGRWNEPICPKVYGATLTEEVLVLERVRALAAEAGIRQSKLRRCAPNILIAYTAQPEEAVRDIMKRRPHSGRALPTAARQDLAEGRYPVRWWYDLRVESRFGQAPVGDHPALLGALTTTAGGPGSGGGGQIATSENQAGYVSDYSSSIIGKKSRMSIGAATVIIDYNAVRGRPKEAVASLVALVALAPLKLPPRPVATPTITNLFQGSEETRALDLTEWDRAYVAALYKTAADRSAKVQQGAMTARIARVMRGEDKRP
jgi:hypothetical protein